MMILRGLKQQKPIAMLKKHWTSFKTNIMIYTPLRLYIKNNISF